MKHYIQILCLTIMLAFTVEGYTQFSYLNARFTYHNAQLYNPGGVISETDYSVINSFVINFDVIHRPLKNLGIGLSTKIPVYESYKYNFIFEGDGVSGGGDNGSLTDRLAEGDFTHELQLESSFVLFARIFFNNLETNSFLDVRYVSESFKESYSYQRTPVSGGSSLLPAQSSSSVNTESLRGIGLAMGRMPMINDHLYYKWQIGVDFVGGAPQNTLDVIQGNFGERYVVPSSFENTAFIFEFSYGIGYKF